ncbi:MAG: LuxR C-terminal-related transcriptional regulator [Acidimicrobiales bacterium]
MGRGEELAYLRDIRRGDQPPLAAVLGGVQGVGKSRLADEALVEARADRWAVERVDGAAATAAVPFGAVAHLAPPEAAGDPLRLLVSTADHLTRRARRRPLLILVDDAQHVDEASLAVLRRLATVPKLTLLLTVRSDQPVPAPIVGLWKDGYAHRIEVQPLSRDETYRLVSQTLGGEVEPASLRWYWDSSLGNPLFLRELVLADQEDGALRPSAGGWSRTTRSGPPGRRLAEVVEGRLGQLDDMPRMALEVVTVAGPLPVDVLTAVVAEEALESLLHQGLLVTRGQGGNDRHDRELTAHLAHPIYGVVLRGHLGPVRIQSHRRRLLEVIEARGDQSPLDTVRVATLRLDHGTDVDTAQLVRASQYVQVAFPQALAERLTTGSARVDEVTAAVAAGDPPGRPSDDDLAVAERLARAAWEAERSPAAGRALTAILVADGRAGDAEQVIIELDSVARTPADHVDVALARAALLLWALGRPDSAMHVLRSTESTTDDPDLLGQLRRLRGGIALNVGNIDDAIELSLPLVETAAPDDPLGALAAATTAAALALAGRPGDSVAMIDRYLPVAQAHIGEIPDALGQLLFGRIFAVRMLGRLDEAEWFAYACYQAAAEFGSLGAMAVFTGTLGQVALDRGRPTAAAQRLREAEVLLRERDSFGYRPLVLAYLASALAQAGDAVAAEGACRQLEEATTWPRFFDAELQLAMAWSHAAAGRTADAVAGATGAADAARTTGVRSFEAGALHTVVRLGAPDAVVKRLEDLAAMIGSPLVDAFAAHAAAAAAADGSALDSVTDRFDQLGAHLLAAEAAAAAAAAHDQTGDATAAFRSMTRSRTLAAACEDAQTPGLRQGMRTPWLTGREHEVATLAADGLTSKAIAERLVVSPRTVESHLYRIFAKLGVSDRSQLADVLGVNPR